MKRYKTANLRIEYGGHLAGALVILSILASAGPYTLSNEAQAQLQPLPQQSPTIAVPTSNQNITTTGSSSIDTTSKMSNETTTTITAKTTTNTPNASLVEFVSNIEQIRGHLDQAIVNKESGNNTLAQAHVLHPIEEIYSSIEEELTNQNSTLNETLSAALQNLSTSVTTATLEEVNNQINSVNALLNKSAQTVIPSSEVSNNPAFNASVVAQLLHVAGHEYEEAVANGTIRAMVEYQDAQAFIQRAETIFKSSTSRMNQNMTQQVQEVSDGFAELNNAVNNKAESETVSTIIDGIIHELEEITGLSESQLIGEEENAEEQDPIALVNNIKSLLAQLTAAYGSQDYQGAENIATEAYLENYEYIEAPLAQRDQQLMEQTEVMLREELRQMITDRVPIEQLEQHIAMINANLDTATQLLQQ